MKRNSQAMLGDDLETLEHGAGRGRRQIAEGVAHEAFESGNAPLDQRLQLIDIVLREQAVETVIDVRFFCGLLFERKPLGRRGRRIDIRHLEHRGDAAHRGCRRAGLPILLVRVPGLAEVHVHVDCAWQQMKAACVERFPRARQRALLADGKYPAVFDRDRSIK